MHFMKYSTALPHAYACVAPVHSVNDSSYTDADQLEAQRASQLPPPDIIAQRAAQRTKNIEEIMKYYEHFAKT